LCQTLSEAYSGAFVAWFVERKNEEFPYRASAEPRFAHHYLSEVGYGKLFKELKADPEAVVILGGWSSPMTNKTLLMTTLLRIPVFIWADHPHPRKRSWLLAHTRSLYLRLLARLVSGFLACGRPTVEHLASLGIKRGKITNFPYWVELPATWSIPKRCLDEESSQRPLRLLTIGRLVPVKQFEVAIEALALANRAADRPVAELIILGEGSERDKLQALTISLGCEETVSFLGWLEIAGVYKELWEADALVITSKLEPFGVVVLEAMAAGRPVLASAGVVAALDRDDGSGAIMLHQIGDAASLAKQITLLATDRHLLQRASINARDIAEKWPPARAVTVLEEALGSTECGRTFMKHREGVGSKTQLAAKRVGPTHESIKPRVAAADGSVQFEAKRT
jgi:glycosyltransferase involved in cell wall biosynthesis